MSTTNEFGYDYVFDLARKLSPEEQSRLLRELASPTPETETPDEDGKNWVIETVSTGNPIFTEEDFARFRKNREALLAGIDWEQAEKNRQELMQLAAACPLASEEEIEMQNEIREAMERWKK